MLAEELRKIDLQPSPVEPKGIFDAILVAADFWRDGDFIRAGSLFLGVLMEDSRNVAAILGLRSILRERPVLCRGPTDVYMTEFLISCALDAGTKKCAESQEWLEKNHSINPYLHFLLGLFYDR